MVGFWIDVSSFFFLRVLVLVLLFCWSGVLNCRTFDTMGTEHGRMYVYGVSI